MERPGTASINRPTGPFSAITPAATPNAMMEPNSAFPQHIFLCDMIISKSLTNA
ncbi:hypothetical protein CGMCC3_g15842 [Colletotrichum fructicola]|nr:uncharacterized protein CGMCC3_g15842 [Colletotrichum fructicola]KAE9568043.1 hypothetical protein CGMCC3_g15842 [Colletotrichum fructicola]